MAILPIDTEVRVTRLGPQNSPYNGKTGRIVSHSNGMARVILDDDPIPHWRGLGILCHPEEVVSVDFD